MPRNAVANRVAVPQAQNLLLRSQEFDNASWDKATFPCSIAANSTGAPDGTATADTITATAGAANEHGPFQALTIAAAPHFECLSCFVKQGNQTWCWLSDTQHGTFGFVEAWFDVTNGVVGTTSNVLLARIDPASTWIPGAPVGWFRIYIAAYIPAGAGNDTTASLLVQPTTANGTRAYAAAGTETLIAWGAQLVQANWPGPYTATAAAAVNTGPLRNLRSAT